MATNRINPEMRADYMLPSQQNTKAGKSDLGKEEFLTLLVAQLQHQDPMSPMENTDYISQLAQFSVVEQSIAMTNATNQSQAYSMIGKTVYAVQRDSEDNALYEIIGKVDSAGMMDGKPYVKVGDSTVYLENVKQVFDTNAIQGSTDVMSSSSIIGKYVQATIIDPDNEKKTQDVSGMVDKIVVKGGAIYLVFNDEKYGTQEIKTTGVKQVSSEPIVIDRTENTTETESDPEITEEGDEVQNQVEPQTPGEDGTTPAETQNEADDIV